MNKKHTSSTKVKSTSKPKKNSTPTQQQQIDRNILPLFIENEIVMKELRQMQELTQQKQLLEFMLDEQRIFNRQRVQQKIPELKESLLVIEMETRKTKESMSLINQQIQQEQQQIQHLRQKISRRYDQKRKLNTKGKQYKYEDKQNNNSLNVQLPQPINQLIRVESTNAYLEDKIEAEKQQIKKLHQILKRKTHNHEQTLQTRRSLQI